MDLKRSFRLDTLFWALLLPAVILALYMAFLEAPREITMKDIQRIFYFHVPAGVAGLTAFTVNFLASLAYLATKKRKWDGLAVASAESGILFIAMNLVTGSIWAKHEWFVWWTWSPRLTSALILCLLYVAYLLVRNYVPDADRRAMMSAVFAVVAFADAPIVWFSIRWWRDQHPSPMLETGGLAPQMRPALYTCMLVFLLLMIYLIRRRYFLETAQHDVEMLERQIA